MKLTRRLFVTPWAIEGELRLWKNFASRGEAIPMKYFPHGAQVRDALEISPGMTGMLVRRELLLALGDGQEWLG